RNNVATEIVLREVFALLAEAGVLGQHSGQGVTVKDVEAHRAEGAFGLWRLLLERDHAALDVGLQYPEAVAFLYGHNYGPERSIGPPLLVVSNHRPVVHAIDMVPRQHQHVVGSTLRNEAEVLVDGVGGA